MVLASLTTFVSSPQPLLSEHTSATGHVPIALQRSVSSGAAPWRPDRPLSLRPGTGRHALAGTRPSREQRNLTMLNSDWTRLDGSLGLLALLRRCNAPTLSPR